MKHKEIHYIMTKVPIQQGYIIFINIYTCNRGGPGYRKQVLTDIKGESDSNIVRDFNTPLTPVDRSSRKNISKKTRSLNNILDHMDLIVHAKHSIKKQQNMHFSQVHMEHSPGQIKG